MPTRNANLFAVNPAIAQFRMNPPIEGSTDQQPEDVREGDVTVPYGGIVDQTQNTINGNTLLGTLTTNATAWATTALNGNWEGSILHLNNDAISPFSDCSSSFTLNSNQNEELKEENEMLKTRISNLEDRVEKLEKWINDKVFKSMLDDLSEKEAE